jgi:hypothetical protein
MGARLKESLLDQQLEVHIALVIHIHALLKELLQIQLQQEQLLQTQEAGGPMGRPPTLHSTLNRAAF